MSSDAFLVHLSPFVSAIITTVGPYLPGPLFSGGHCYVSGLAFRTDRMVEVDFQPVDDQTRLGMVVPEHAEVPDTDSGH